MSDPTPPAATWQVLALIGRTGTSELLVDASGSDVVLPAVLEPASGAFVTTPVLQAVEARIGQAIVPRRLNWLPEVQGWTSGAVVVETEPIDTPPGPGLDWRPAAEVVEAIASDSVRPVVQRSIARDAGRGSPLEPPWARTGWFARTSRWMVDRMAEAGLNTTDPPRLVYQSPLGSVLRAASGEQAIFLKCIVSAFPHEAAISAAIARHSPELGPGVIASDPDENWLLMHDHGGRTLDDQPASTWAPAMTLVAAFHRDWSARAGEVVQVGAQIRPLARLADGLPTLLDRHDLGARLAPAVREAWVTALPRLQAACATLGSFGLPDTVIHGDLHPGNVVIGPDRLRLVDWSDAAVTHPFLDVGTFLLRATDLEVRHHLWRTYLDGWDGAVPESMVRTAGDLAMIVGALYQTETCLELLPAMDAPDRAMFEHVDERWLRRALDALEFGLDVPAVQA